MKRFALLSCLAASAFAQAPQPAPNARPDGLYAIFKTSMGDIAVQLFEKDAPLTVQNFVGLAKGTKGWVDPKTHVTVHRPMYNNIVFHRIMLDGMIQAGDPTGTGDGLCSIKIKDEIRPNLKFDQPGRLAMANIGQPNTGGCQWFITQAASAAPWDGSYTIFGQVVEGQDVVKAISRLPVVSRDTLRPKNPPTLTSVTIERVGAAPAAATPPKFPPAHPPATAPTKK